MAVVKYDIDYRVTFPSTNNPSYEKSVKYGHSINESNVEQSKKEPVVILLGWAGCENRHIAKYSAIYEKRCVTVSYTAPNRDIFFRSNNLCHAAEKLLEIIVDLDLEAHPIFVHSFSNGGGLVYRWISETIHSKTEFKQIRLAGAIFDSCPGKRRLFKGLKVLMMITSKRSAFIKFFFGVAFICFVFLESVKLKIKEILRLSTIQSTYWQALENDTSTCPQLYLYSKKDDIVSYRDVEDMTAVRIQRGVDIQSICWEDSGHVAHLVTHRESYIKSCLDFIDYCVERWI